MSIKISHHLLLCASTEKDQSCCKTTIGIESWNRLKAVIKELDLESPYRKEGIVLRSKINCLRVCKNGPILLIWPDGIWYEKVSPKLIELIIRQHILQHNPIPEYILKKTPFKKQTKKVH